ncbi:MAG: phosphoadenylyl-sulfate reductase [Hyphomicrobiales bacterium]
MTYEQLKSQLENFGQDSKRCFTTCSFQTHSLPLLHMVTRIDPSIPVVFINTGYHFPDTLAFRDQIVEAFGIRNLIELESITPKSMQMDGFGKLLYTSDADHCCYLNKTQPLNEYMRSYDVWINGVRADQSSIRANMKEVQAAPHDVVRLHPLLSWSEREVYAYIREFDLPRHPLDEKGYLSIGCEPCTRKIDPEMSERESRWYGMNKVECGLHTELIDK